MDDTAEFNVDSGVSSVLEDLDREHNKEGIVKAEVLKEDRRLIIKIPMRSTLKRKRTEVNEEEVPEIVEEAGEGEEDVIEEGGNVGKVGEEDVMEEVDCHTAGDGASGPLLFHRFLLHSSNRLRSMDVVPEDLRCTIKCGEANPKQAVVSEFLIQNQSNFETVLSLRKYVIISVSFLIIPLQ